MRLNQRSHSSDPLDFAAFAYVGESVDEPLIYYDNNTRGTLSILAGARSRGRSALGVQLHLRDLRRAGGHAD